MEPVVVAEPCRATRPVPMAQTVFWLASLPFRLPTWLVVTAGSEFFRRLQRSLLVAFSSSALLRERRKRTLVHTGGQTELSMAQLNNVIAVSDLNEEAVAAQLQQLERTRKENGNLQSVLKSTDDRVSILEQCIADLEVRNVRLYGTLAHTVLPVLQRLACAAQQSEGGAGSNEAMLEELSAQVLEAFVRAQQVVAEAGDGASECSPAAKLGTEESLAIDRSRSGQRALAMSRSMPVPGLSNPEVASWGPTSKTPKSPPTCKALSFESPARGSTVKVQVLTDDV